MCTLATFYRPLSFRYGARPAIFIIRSLSTAWLLCCTCQPYEYERSCSYLLTQALRTPARCCTLMCRMTSMAGLWGGCLSWHPVTDARASPPWRYEANVNLSKCLERLAVSARSFRACVIDCPGGGHSSNQEEVRGNANLASAAFWQTKSCESAGGR